MSAREKPEKLKAWAEGVKRENYSDNDQHAEDGCDRCDAYRLASMVLRVLEIHDFCPDVPEHFVEGIAPEHCSHCLEAWPCPTVKALCDELGEEGKG